MDVASLRNFLQKETLIPQLPWTMVQVVSQKVVPISALNFKRLIDLTRVRHIRISDWMNLTDADMGSETF